MNIGIDIGSHKTVIFSSALGGDYVKDELGNREIPTVIEVSPTHRAFGKMVSSDSPKHADVHFREFLNNLNSFESQTHTFMFLEYLSRLLSSSGYASASLAISEGLDETERAILQRLVQASSLRVDAFFTHTTAAASQIAFRGTSVPEYFILIDFGHSKTTIGLFHFKDHVLRAVSRFFFPLGASSLDESLFSFLVDKHALPRSSLIRERIFKVLPKIKVGLNSLDLVSSTIYDENYNPITLNITSDEFANLSASFVESISSFIESNLADPKFKEIDGPIKIVGGNSNAKIISDIVDKSLQDRRMQTTCVVARGACAAHHVNWRRWQGGPHRVDEIYGREVEFVFKDGNEPIIKIAPDTIIDTVINAEIKVKSTFILSLMDNKQPVAELEIKIPDETDETSDEVDQIVKLTVAINKFCTVEVREVLWIKENSTPIKLEYDYRILGFDSEQLAKIKAIELEYFTIEENARVLDSFRNQNETFLYRLESELDRAFPELLEDEERKLIKQIGMEYCDSICGTMEEEQAKKDKFMEELQPIKEKLENEEDKMNEETKVLLKITETYTKNEGKENKTIEQREFMRIAEGLKYFMRSNKIDIEKIAELDQTKLTQFKANLKKCLEMQRRREEEAEQRKAERKKREESETKKREENEAKKREENDEMQSEAQADKECVEEIETN